MSMTRREDIASQEWNLEIGRWGVSKVADLALSSSRLGSLDKAQDLEARRSLFSYPPHPSSPAPLRVHLGYRHSFSRALVHSFAGSLCIYIHAYIHVCMCKSALSPWRIEPLAGNQTVPSSFLDPLPLSRRSLTFGRAFVFLDPDGTGSMGR